MTIAKTKNIWRMLAGLLAASVLALSSSQAEPAGTCADIADVDACEPRLEMKDFSLLEGKWEVRSESLADRLGENETWQVNQMETHYRILLGGLVAINETYGTFNGRDMHGIMIRTYDPAKDEWLFQWMSKGYPHLTEQVRGRFEKGVGLFYGSETYRGREFKMRFRWRMANENNAYWDQSYHDPVSLDWKVNWKLILTKQ